MSTNTKLAEALRACMADIELWMETYKRQAGSLEVLDRAREALAAHDAEQAALRELECPPDPETVERELAAQAVPAGFKLVPVEPDLGMLQSALNASRANVACGMTRMLTDGCELWAAGEAYRAMLAAAPAAPAPEALPGASPQRLRRDRTPEQLALMESKRAEIRARLDAETQAQAAGQEPGPGIDTLAAVSAALARRPQAAPAPEAQADTVDAQRWRTFIGLPYATRAEWAANLSIAPVLTQWVDEAAKEQKE